MKNKKNIIIGLTDNKDLKIGDEILSANNILLEDITTLKEIINKSNAVIIKDLLDKKVIDSTTANKYIMCNFFINPLFLETSFPYLLNKFHPALALSIAQLK